MTKRKTHKKTVRHSSSNTSYHATRHVHTARTVIPLLVLLLAFGMFGLFYTYQQSIIDSNSFNLFIVLSVIGMALLVSLLFLVNPRKK